VKTEKLRTKSFRIIRCSGRYLRIVVYFSLFTFSFSLLSVVAQDDPDLAPPPLKIISKEERAKLDAEVDLKSRTKLAVELMRLRIDAAEKLNSGGSFDGVFRELGDFRALLDYSFAFLKRENSKDNKTLDNYKRIELSLRAVTPRLEAIRRELPMRYEEYVRQLMNYIRDARSKAAEHLFSDTVLPNEAKGEKENEK